jgi:hypothetical protein
VLERAVRATRIELVVAERKRGGVTEHKLGRPPPRELSTARHLEQRRAAVEPDGTTSRTDDLRQPRKLRPGAASHVEHALSTDQLEQFERASLFSRYKRDRSDVVELAAERSRIAGGVDVGVRPPPADVHLSRPRLGP